jgi:hypothetical protein
MNKIGYHNREIEKGVFGEVSKIREEFEEFMDAHTQGVTLMELQELSDMFLAVDGYLQKHHPTISLTDLIKMADVTRRVFENGRR